MDRIDVQTWELQKHYESKCRHIYKKECDYSGPVEMWNKRLRCYNDLLRRYSKGVRNMSNVVKRCWNVGISNPKQLTQQQCGGGATYCRQRLRSMKKQLNWLRQQMLEEKLREAEATGNTEARQEISQLIQREWNRSTWPRINQAVDDPRLGAMKKVQRREFGVR